VRCLGKSKYTLSACIYVVTYLTIGLFLQSGFSRQVVASDRSGPHTLWVLA
jgi:hypothetical protein